eukprot:GILK01000806.1.p1 GENE.GILK01000806.1~~GILK01000806.1.p1  ORF type:complete len:560 (+),score=45.23 GILK01000806.1:183-1682(+)
MTPTTIVPVLSTTFLSEPTHSFSDIALYIFGYLSGFDLGAISSVSKGWKEVSEDFRLWKALLSSSDVEELDTMRRNTMSDSSSSADSLNQFWKSYFIKMQTHVYVMGCIEDEDAQGENVSLAVDLYRPRPIPSLSALGVKQVACGGEHAAAVTALGHIYTWGKAGFGRLGHGDGANQSVPKRVAALSTEWITHVDCGYAFTAAISMKGELYTWGAGENGRTGHGNSADEFVPKKVKALVGRTVVQVCCGSCHTAILLSDGSVWTCGKHEYTGHNVGQDSLVPRQLSQSCFNGEFITQISVGPGGYHTSALAASGAVYVWGHNRVGQLGFSDVTNFPHNDEGALFLPSPRLLKDLAGVDAAQVVCGWGHTILRDREGQVYSCGRNVQGQLGLGDPANFRTNERGHAYQPTFRKVERLPTKIRAIVCGSEHTAALGENGRVYAWGHQHKGQCGHPSSSGPIIYPREIEAVRNFKVLSLSCGNACTVIISQTHGRTSEVSAP